MQRGRDAALDNLKGLLIISVVYVHFYDMLGQKTPLLFTLRTIILTVQMPLFVFLSGYFGKHTEKRRDAAWAEYLVPFLLFNTLYYLIRMDQESSLSYGLFRPQNMYWFLLTLLIIRVLMPQLIRVRHILPISIVLALLVGGDPDIGRELSLSRTFCFLPFYLMGYYCTPAQMRRIRRMPVPVALTGAAAGAYLALWLTEVLRTDKDASHPFQLVNSYETQGLSMWAGIEFRLAIYIAAPLLAILLLRLVSSRAGLLTMIGRGSMTVYLLHAFPMLWIVGHWDAICAGVCRLFPALADVSKPGTLLFGIPQLVLLLLYAFLISLLLSSPPVVRVYNRFVQEVQCWLFRAAGREAQAEQNEIIQKK